MIMKVFFFEILPLKIQKEDRRLLISYYVYRLSVLEISNNLGISKSACKMRLFRLRKVIQALLEQGD